MLMLNHTRPAYCVDGRTIALPYIASIKFVIENIVLNLEIIFHIAVFYLTLWVYIMTDVCRKNIMMVGVVNLILGGDTRY